VCHDWGVNRLGIVAVFVLLLSGSALARGRPRAIAADGPLVVSVSSAEHGQAMAPGFIGMSLEYKALHLYTGRDPRTVDPVFVQLLRQLAPGQAPVIRIGGDSADQSWWPIPGVVPPGGISYRLTNGWLRTTQALAATLGAKLILGLNLAAGRPSFAAAEARAFLQGIGRRYISAFEIGNEPDLYPVFPWFRDRRGHLARARGRHYDLNSLIGDYKRFRAALPSVPVAGPALSGPSWMGRLGHFLSTQRGLSVATYHRYPLRACTTDPNAPSFPTIPALLADSASAGLAKPLAGYASVAHAHHVKFRVAEMNSASCEGKAGVSDTFASALWALDTLFNMARAGVDGVNLHSLPGASYEPFSFSHDTSGAWQAFVHPEYYGLLLFGRAFPPGAKLLSVTAPSGPVKIWATSGVDGETRVVVINKDPAAAHTVQLQLPGTQSEGSLESLLASSVDATNGVTLGGQTFGSETATGALPGPEVTVPIDPVAGTYSLDVPPASAVLLTKSS
jgi:Glycosyl hydrolase family 79 C-terminal beta domain